MKNTSSTTLALLTLVLAAGCSAAPDAGTPAGNPSGGPAVTLPSPNAAQQEALLASLAGIDPRLADGQAVDRARSLCGSILGMATGDQLIAAAKARFTAVGGSQLTDGDAQRILTAISANGFCR
ncbi:hypothetical protein [Arthrobacter sp. PM3]|uniref:hypothetical protein n=1 Tax=Arthrobacter sp. PM3 TaxID=2017685 RepID=UPI000E108C1B|nr:hypothetical protein [Arthrobacter sp. PM3]AXJ08201.1 hypothetical protein CFN17_00040 [Arthrobacter sp. PM3]